MKNNENMNTISTVEDRDFIYKARKFYENLNQKKENIQESYQKNIVDTGISTELEEKIDKEAKSTKRIVKIAGTVATIALIFIPADGPFGEMATLLATPAFCKLVDLVADIKKKVLISGKRGFEKNFMNVNSQNDEIQGYNMENGEFIDDIKEAIKIGRSL